MLFDFEATLREAYHRPRVYTPEIDDDRKQERLNLLILAYESMFRRFAEQFGRGERTADWFGQQMAQAINNLHLAAAILAVDGASHLSNTDMQVITRHIAKQERYLQNFTSVIRPPAPFNQAVIETRARSYAASATATYSRVFADALGLPELPAYPGDGTTACLQWCRCAWKIEKLEGQRSWNCYWRRSAAESCPQCIQRERAWSPLKIRDGIIQPYETKGVYGG